MASIKADIEGPRLKQGLSKALQVLGTDTMEIVFYHLKRRGYTFSETSKYPLEQVISQLDYILGDVGAAIVGKALENSLTFTQGHE